MVKEPCWKHIGDGWYQLARRYCYIGVNVFIVPSRGRFKIRLVNYCDTPKDGEISRKQGEVESKKSWKTASGAKRFGARIGRDKEWLELAGIRFKIAESE